MDLPNKKNCCHMCEKRTAECHATCKEYAEYARQAEEIRMNRYKAKEFGNAMRSMKRDGCEKTRRLRGK